MRRGSPGLLLLCLGCAPAVEGGRTPSPTHHSGFQPAGYGCVHHDEFECAGARCGVDRGVWAFQNLDVNGELQQYTSRECADPAHADDWNLCVSQGALQIRARPLDAPLDCTKPGQCADAYGQAEAVAGTQKRYTSGRITSKGRLFDTYGYIETAVRLPFAGGASASGLWPSAFLLDNCLTEGPLSAGCTTRRTWPAGGEIDLWEGISWSGALQGNAHWRNERAADPHASCDSRRDCWSPLRNDGRVPLHAVPGFEPDDWNRVGVLWTPERLDWFVEGQWAGGRQLGVGQDEEFQRPFHLLLNMAVGGALGGEVGPSLDWSRAVAEYGYVRWYQAGAKESCGLGSDPPAAPVHPDLKRPEWRLDHAAADDTVEIDADGLRLERKQRPEPSALEVYVMAPPDHETRLSVRAFAPGPTPLHLACWGDDPPHALVSEAACVADGDGPTCTATCAPGRAWGRVGVQVRDLKGPVRLTATAVSGLPAPTTAPIDPATFWTTFSQDGLRQLTLRGLDARLEAGAAQANPWDVRLYHLLPETARPVSLEATLRAATGTPVLATCDLDLPPHTHLTEPVPCQPSPEGEICRVVCPASQAPTRIGFMMGQAAGPVDVVDVQMTELD